MLFTYVGSFALPYLHTPTGGFSSPAEFHCALVQYAPPVFTAKTGGAYFCQYASIRSLHHLTDFMYASFMVSQLSPNFSENCSIPSQFEYS